MRLSRTDLLPVLTILAGGVIGASLSLSAFVLWSPSGNEPTVVPLMRVVSPDEPSSVSVDCADNGVVVWFFVSEEGQVLDRRVCP